MKNVLNKYVGYVSHSYDLIFFARLSKYFNCKLDVLINARLFSSTQELLISKSFPFLRIEYVEFGEGEATLFKRLTTFKRLQNSFRVSNKTIILLDKSKLSSRFILKTHNKKILLQATSVDISELDFDWFRSFKESCKSLYLNLGLTRIYSDKNSYAYEILVNLYKAQVIQSNCQFIPLNENRESSIPTDEILVFGSRFWDWPFFEQTQYNLLIQIYREVFETLGVKQVRYMPHPRESGREFEYLKSNLDYKFHIVEGYLNAEHYLLVNKHIMQTFSIGSTASRSSAQYGIKSIVCYRHLNLDKQSELLFDNIFKDDGSIIFDCYSLMTKEHSPQHISKSFHFDDRLIKLIINE